MRLLSFLCVYRRLKLLPLSSLLATFCQKSTMKVLDDLHFKNQPEGRSKVMLHTYFFSLCILIVALVTHITTYSLTTYPPLSGPPTVRVSEIAVITMTLFTPISTLLLVLNYLPRLKTLSTRWLIVFTLLHIFVVGTIAWEMYRLIFKFNLTW